MSRLFDNAANDYLYASSAPVTTTPCTIAGWVYPDELVSTFTLCCLDYDSNNYRQVGIDSNGKVRARSRDSSTSATAFTSTTNTNLNEWKHIAGVFASATSRKAYLNGGGKSENTTSATPTASANTKIGYTTGLSTSYASGKIAEVGIWNIALSDSEISALAAGADPRTIQPSYLQELWSFGTSSLTGLKGTVLSATGTSYDTGEIIIYGDGLQTQDEATQSAAGTVSSVTTNETVSPSTLAATVTLNTPTDTTSISVSPNTETATASLSTPTVSIASSYVTFDASTLIASARLFPIGAASEKPLKFNPNLNKDNSNLPHRLKQLSELVDEIERRLKRLE